MPAKRFRLNLDKSYDPNILKIVVDGERINYDPTIFKKFRSNQNENLICVQGVCMNKRPISDTATSNVRQGVGNTIWHSSDPLRTR